jgi:hypothetical protein
MAKKKAKKASGAKKASKKSASRKRVKKKAGKVRAVKASKKKSKVPPVKEASLPAALLTLVRFPISGTYFGAMQQPDPGLYELELRVDVDQSHANAPVMNRISWDVSQVFSDSGNTWRVYRDSWIIDDPVVLWGQPNAKVSGSARSWGSSESLAAEITIPWTVDTIGPAEVRLIDGSDESTFSCDWKSNLFRQVELQIDVCASVDSRPLLPDYNTHAHRDRPTGIVERNLTIEEAYGEAGIGVTIPESHTVLDDSDPNFFSWTPAELHEAMVDHFEGLSDSPQWRLWGLMAGRFESPGVGGIMFDAASQFGGAGRAPERQGFALFRNHSWFNNLVDGVPSNQAQAWSARHFLYTWVHEAGHAFNHLHSWDKSRPDALSWMNYDWRYDSRNGEDAFWKNFEFRFDDQELLHLRHGARNAVIMGGDSWGSGGHMETHHAAMSQLELVGGEPPVEVLLRSKEVFQFMEPVSLELRLRNLTKKTIKADGNVQPEFGVVAVLIRAPDGQVHHYEPLMCKLAVRTQVSLNPPTKTQTGSDRHSETLDVTFGKRGFYFDRPGQYSIRVIYQGINGSLIPSNLHRIRIGYPTSPESEQIAQDYFTRDVGLALYFNGSRSQRLKRAMSTLQELTSRFPTQAVGVKAATVLASAEGRPFFRVAGNKISCEAKADPEAALSLTEPALAVYANSKSKSANLPHRNLVEQRADYWISIDEKQQAKAEITTLSSVLEHRGVNSSVIKDVENAL